MSPSTRPSQVLLAALFLWVLASLPPALALPSEGFQWVQASGPLIAKDDGEPIILRGTNLPPPYAYKKSTAYALYLDVAKSIRSNVVRLPVLWSELEPVFGKINIQYVNLIREIVRLAEQRGIYVVVDMHQWRIAEKFGGRGFPSWVVKDFESIDAAALGFWGNLAFQRELVEAWKLLASYLKDEKAIFAYDFLNEPFAGSIPWNQFSVILTDFYAKLISEIRPVDPRHAILFEPTDVCACTSIFGSQIPIKPQGSNLVFSPHMYVRGPRKYLDYYVGALYNLTVKTWKIPLWIGEFGGEDVELQDQNSMDRLNITLNVLAQYGLGWAYWRLADIDNGPQLIDAHGRASRLLTDMIIRGAEARPQFVDAGAQTSLVVATAKRTDMTFSTLSVPEISSSWRIQLIIGGLFVTLLLFGFVRSMKNGKRRDQL